MTERDRADPQSGAAPEQWKTLREIADEIGTGKMNVYRYARAAGLEGVTLPGAGNGQKRFYDVTAQMAIKQHFENKTVTTVTGRPLHEALHCNGEPLQSNGQTATGCNGSDDQLEELHRLRQEVESLTADREALIKQVNQMRGEITGHAAEVKRLVDQLDQLRQDHRQELDRIQTGHAAELDRLRTDHRQQLDDLRAQLDEVKHDLTEERQHSRDTAERLAQLADQAQRLQLAQMQPPAALPEEITPQDKPPTLWQRIFGKKG
jgi:myosin heavy subunit